MSAGDCDNGLAPAPLQHERGRPPGNQTE